MPNSTNAPIGNRRGMRRVDVGDQPVQHEAQADAEQDHEDHQSADMWPGVEIGFWRGTDCESFRHWIPLELP